MQFPLIEKQETTYKVTFLDGREKICGTLTRALEAAQEESDTITFVPFERIEKAPYTGSIYNDPIYNRKL